MSRVIVDTGPLVALLNPRDPYHDWARETAARIKPPLATCEAVITETAFLVRTASDGPAAVLELIARQFVEIAFHVDAELLALQRLVERYSSLPMSLADACLVRMSELDPKAAVLTLDSHFRDYRRSGRLVIPLIAPA